MSSNLLVGSWDLSTVTWGDKAKRSDERFHGAAVADLGAGQWGIGFPTGSHRADARVTSGAEYVLSFWARADVAGDKIRSEVWGSKYMLDTTLTTEWRLVSMPYGILKADTRNIFFWGLATNSGSVHVALPMCVRGTEPAAWAPAEGESLSGGGAQMSANLWSDSTASMQIRADGTYLAGKAGTAELNSKVTGLDSLTENQTVHMGASLKGADAGVLKPYVEYKDAAGNTNCVGFPSWQPTDSWQRFENTCVVPSGMTVCGVGFSNDAATGDIEVSNPVFNYGSPVTLASSAHTPYATQDHVSVTYATKASLKVTDDSITAEVSARAQTDQNVADLSSRLTQTENSLTSEISDRKSAITTVAGLANAAQSTADGAAKQANLYTIGLGDAGAVAKWIHIGTLTSAGDSSSATISIVFGNGYNGRAGQNSAMTITIKDGFQSTGSATKACGVTAMRENCDTALVDVLAQSATVYDVWVYAPWAHSNGRYSVSGQYAAWQHSGATQEDEPATSATQVKQDVAYRLADATKAQTMATENKSSIKQLSDSITSEVTERSKLAGRVGTLESTSSTHTSKLEQLATSIKSLVKGESTYTDPDGKSATSGIYSLVTQTRDSVTALFGSYTKTADLASTQAVKDAKKAGTDAQAAASAAQSTADSAKSTAQDAKKTADGISVGGRNIARGTATLTNDVQAGENPRGFGTCDYLGGIKSMGVSTAWSGIYFRLKDMADAGRIKAGQQYTASVYVMSETDLTTTFQYYRFTSRSNKPTVDELTGSSYEVVDLKAGEWHQLKCTFTATSGDDSTLTSNRARIENVRNVEVWYAGPKLDSGNRATDYSPAPEDVDAGIVKAQTTADSAKSTAQTAASDAATAKTNAASAVSTANSASTSAANAVETANAASSTASSASSTANSAASTANSAKSTADAAKTSAASAVSTANSASSTAGAAKSTADSLATMVRQYSGGVLVGKVGAGVCALVNADGSFDVVDVTWDGETPTIDRSDPSTEPTRASLDADSVSFIRGAASISTYADTGGHEGMATESGIDISLYGGVDNQMPVMRMTGGNIAGTGSASRNSIVLVPGSTEVDGSMTSGLVEAKGEFAVNGGPASIASGARTFSVQAGDTASAYIDDTRWANLSTDALTIDQEHVYAQYFGDYYIDLAPEILFQGSYDYTKGHGVTLSEPASNFYLMCIIARGEYGVYDSVTVSDPDGKKVAFDIANVAGTHREHHTKVFWIQGQTIDTFNDNGYWEGKLVVDGGAVSQVSESCVGIECVIGWRKGGQR